MTLENYIKKNFTWPTPPSWTTLPPRGKNVCLVGNSFVTKKHGKAIDSHDVVIRINKYILSDKFTPFIGKKTTHYCSDGLGRRKARAYANVLCPFRERCEDDWGGKKICPSKDWRKETGVERLTTGSTMLYILDRLGVSTSAFGFDFLRTGHMWDKEYCMRKNHGSHFKKIREEEVLIKSLPNVKMF